MERESNAFKGEITTVTLSLRGSLSHVRCGVFVNQKERGRSRKCLEPTIDQRDGLVSVCVRRMPCAHAGGAPNTQSHRLLYACLNYGVTPKTKMERPPSGGSEGRLRLVIFVD